MRNCSIDPASPLLHSYSSMPGHPNQARFFTYSFSIPNVNPPQIIIPGKDPLPLSKDHVRYNMQFLEDLSSNFCRITHKGGRGVPLESFRIPFQLVAPAIEQVHACFLWNPFNEHNTNSVHVTGDWRLNILASRIPSCPL
jgi:hypothetical protein